MKIITRTLWNATSYDGVLNLQPRIDTIVIHHSAGPAGACLAEGAHLIRGIQHDHTFRRRWADIGYHFVIDGVGNVFQGREWKPAGEFTLSTRLAIGSHVKGRNTGKVGVCVLGNYEKDDLSEASASAVVDLCSLLCKTYGLDPLMAISGHRDFLPTLCPGEHLYEKLPSLRERTHAAMEPLSSRLRTALLSHRCVNWVDDVTEDPQLLVDVLSLDGGSISMGEEEIDAIVDAVLDVLDDKAD